MLGLAVLLSCLTVNLDAASQKKSETGNSVDLIVFYDKNCSDDFKKMKQLTKDLVKELFKADVKAGYLTLEMVDYSKKRNEAVAKEYNIKKPSIYAVTYIDGQKGVYNLTYSDLKYKKGEDEQFKNKLKYKMYSHLKSVKPQPKRAKGSCGCGRKHDVTTEVHDAH